MLGEAKEWSACWWLERLALSLRDRDADPAKSHSESIRDAPAFLSRSESATLN
jgi:hypothetical protein